MPQSPHTCPHLGLGQHEFGGTLVGEEEEVIGREGELLDPGENCRRQSKEQGEWECERMLPTSTYG